tara:strand:- start:84 stop:269 length:186 start_codon:yes stop_codon:yes gene_type:complete
LINKKYIKVRQGTIDLIILILIFIGIQAWWIIPIIKNNNKIKNSGKDFIEEIKKLERIYKK